MICPPCAQAATPLAQWEIDLLGGDVGTFDPTHRPEICRDHAMQPHGCGCQHGQRAATEGNDRG